MPDSGDSFKPEALADAECERALERNGIGRLACYSPSARQCYVIPVAYAYHPGSLYFALAPGQKLAYLGENPHGVCFEIEEVSGGSEWTTIVVFGDFERVEAAKHPLSHAERGPLHDIFDVGLTPFARDSLVLCKLSIRRMSGRRDRWLPASKSRAST
jgi:nitroimidazol reductase NimA-like FMN-containing flavoprotein (pyridoxamine 5'-phosphate oxidase superfamily)